MPDDLNRRSVTTGEPDNTERVPSGSVGGRGKRSVSYLARGLPNLLRRCGFRRQVSASVRCSRPRREKNVRCSQRCHRCRSTAAL